VRTLTVAVHPGIGDAATRTLLIRLAVKGGEEFADGSLQLRKGSARETLKFRAPELIHLQLVIPGRPRRIVMLNEKASYPYLQAINDSTYCEPPCADGTNELAQRGFSEPLSEFA
jgi:hypothetical protein